MSSTSSSPERPPGPRPAPATVLVGTILRPHGVRGELVVEVASDVAGRFAAGSELVLRRGDGGEARAVRVVKAAVSGRRARILLEGCTSREDAEALRGGELEVPVERVPPAPAGAFWHHELVGAACRDRRAGELGVIEELVEHGGRPLLRVRGVRGELLIPFAEPFLGGLDRQTRTLEVDLPPGLIETCASPF